MKVLSKMKGAQIRRTIMTRRPFEFKFAETVSRAYPYSYGFIVGTNADDGCNVDCFVITNRPLRTGQTFECEPS